MPDLLRRCCFLLLCFCAASLVHAQETGLPPENCPTGQAEASLDVGNVRARIFNTGGLFVRGRPLGYEVPKGSGTHSIFAAGLWVGGLVEGELRIAASSYGPYEFWPGPSGTGGQPPEDCGQAFDRIYDVYRTHVASYERTGSPEPDLRDWPVHLGAPVLDGDGVPDNYNLAGGDRPALLGDEMLWWIMNDMGGPHEKTDAPPVGLEARVSAFAFDVGGTLGTSTFYRYQLTYHGDEPLDSAYIAFFTDGDLGTFDDDYVGTDTTLGMAYYYNSDNDDEGSEGYGEAPPAIGFSFLQGIRAVSNGSDDDGDSRVDEPGERMGMTVSAFYFGGGCLTCDPRGGVDFYNYMQARWPDGQPMTVGGYGRDESTIPTVMAYPGDPVEGTYWSEVNSGGRFSSANAPGDRRLLISTGPFRMEPGTTQDLVVALVWARGTSNLDSVTELRKAMRHVQSIRDRVLTPTITAGKTPEPQPTLAYAKNAPNPFRERTVIRYSVPEPQPVRLTVYDLLGREVTTLVDAVQDAGLHEAVFEAPGLPPGVYVYRLTIGRATATGRMVRR